MAITNENNKGTEEKPASINAPIIGMNINAVGVLATTPEMKLTIISKRNDIRKGLSAWKGIAVKIS